MSLRPLKPVFLGALLLAASGRAAEFDARLRPLFEGHCYDCHDADAKKGGLNLEGLKWMPQDPANLELWTKLFDKVRTGEMPPKEKPRPEAGLAKASLAVLQRQLHTESMSRQLEAGRVVSRRLNRSEYVNTIHDLLGVDSPLLDLLPADATKGGFDTIGEAHHLSDVHLERYLEAADTALREATITTPGPGTRKIRTDFNQTWHERYSGFANLNWTHSPEGLLALRFNGSDSPEGELGSWTPPVPNARYRFRIRAKAMLDHDPDKDTSAWNLRAPALPDSLYTAGVNSVKWHESRRIILKVALADWPRTGLTVDSAYFEMSPTEFREFEYEARVPAGKTLFVGPYRAVPETPGERAMVKGLCSVVEWIDIEGPFYDEWPPKGHRLLYGDLPLKPAHPESPGKDLQVASDDPETDARRLLKSFLPKAFRRPVKPDELEDYVSFFQKRQREGSPFSAALRAAYKRALCSPHFIFLHESAGTLGDHALACRLSYALWGSMPDEILRQLADESKLHEPETLRQQVERLLASPQSKRFTRNFLGGWLNLRDIDFTQPDTKLYPEFEQYLQRSMVGETEQFFEELLRNNLSVRNIVHSDFAMLNERLAEHYGIAGVKGEWIRKVNLPAGSRRGGFITQGAVLKVSANGTTTSPVVRGAYILDRIFGTPPDPPPKDVTTIEPDIRGATTIREQLEKHRDQPVCAGCHAKLDPPGFALENYDVTGRWRTKYRAIPEWAKDKVVKLPGSDNRYYVDGPAVNPAYQLSDGSHFTDIDEFKTLILANPIVLTKCFTEKLITHLTGATSQFADREVIDAIVKKSAASDYGVRTILHEVIQSRVFTNK